MASSKDVFLSYGRDQEVIYFVQSLKRDLEANGFSVWLDSEDVAAGSDWQSAVSLALSSCKAIVPVITRKYLASHFCSIELSVASSEHKHVFPVFLEDVDFSSSDEVARRVISEAKGTMFRSHVDDYYASLEQLKQNLKGKGLGKGLSDTTALAHQMAQIQISPQPSAPPPSSALSPPTGHYPPPSSALSPPSGHYPPPSSALSPPTGHYPPSAVPPQLYYAQSHTPYQPQLQPAYPPPPSTAYQSQPPIPYPPRPDTTAYPSPHPNPAVYYPQQQPPHPGYAPPQQNPNYGGPAYPYMQSPYGGPPPPPSTGYYQSPGTVGIAHPSSSPYSPAEGQPLHPVVGHNEPPPPYLQGGTENERTKKQEKANKVFTKKENAFKVGTKLEAADRRFPYFVCVATVMDRKDDDDKLMIHFDGWGPSYNYWCYPDDVGLHPMGWCERHGWELQKPLELPWTDWSIYLEETHSKSAADELFSESQLVGPGSLLFEHGMKIEAVDKSHPFHIVRVATIDDVRPGEVKVHFDGWGHDKDCWCSSSSTDIHPPMWSGKILKQQVQPPNGHQEPFKWNECLCDPSIVPAPAYLFTKAQLSDGKGPYEFEKGMYLEAKDRLNPMTIAVAVIDNIKDGMLLIHFEGWGTRYDYWCAPDCEDVHPKGWCERSSQELQPPKGFTSMLSFDWDSYLDSCGGSCAPEHLFTQEQKKTAVSRTVSFQAGMRLEAKDKQNASLTCVATVTEVNSAGELLIHFDGWGSNYDYWCKPNTPDIHPVGWCEKTHKQLQAPKGYNKGTFRWSDYLSGDIKAAPKDLFTQEQKGDGTIRPVSFQAGMRVEAKDKLNPSLTCVATVTEVNSAGELLIHFDGWGSNYDYWCKPNTPDIHPVGWCEKIHKQLQAPKGYTKGVFRWSDYMIGSVIAAPEYLFTLEQKNVVAQSFKPGMRLEAKDKQNPSLVCVATVTEVNKNTGKLLIHFDGWSSKYDYWSSPDDPDIHPVGWCEKKGSTVQAPNDMPDYEGSFDWDDYLEDMDEIAAPVACFTQKQL